MNAARLACGALLALSALGCEAQRPGPEGAGGAGAADGACETALDLKQVGVGDPVVLEVSAVSRCAASAVVEVRLGHEADVLILEDGLGQAVLDCPPRDRTAVARFLTAEMVRARQATAEVDCGFDPLPPPRQPELDAPGALAAYRCEAGEVRGVSADDRSPVLCAGPGLQFDDPTAQEVPCGSCDPACAGVLPAEGTCWRLAPGLDGQGAYSAPLVSVATARTSAAVCAADTWGRMQSRQVALAGVGFVGAWVSPGRVDLGPEHVSGEGRACAEVRGADGRPLADVPLAFDSGWGTVFVNPRARTDHRGVACVDLLLTGAVSPDTDVRARVAEQCGGGGLPEAVAPVRVAANPPSPAESELVCTPSVLPGFDPLAEVEARCTLTLLDRFGGPVAATAVGFAAEAGELSETSVVTDEQGVAEVTLRADGRRPVDVEPLPGEPSLRRPQGGPVQNPRDGYVTVVAWWMGEEAFGDEDGDGLREAGEPLMDLPAPFVDCDDDGAWSEGEPRVDHPGDASVSGNGRWDAHAPVWTETRLIWTDSPDPQAALTAMTGCEPDSPPAQCGPDAAFQADRTPCRVTIPLHDSRLNPPAGAWRATLSLADDEPLHLSWMGEAGWGFQRTPGLSSDTFHRAVGFDFGGPGFITAHLSSSGDQLEPASLTLAVDFDLAPDRTGEFAQARQGCALR